MWECHYKILQKIKCSVQFTQILSTCIYVLIFQYSPPEVKKKVHANKKHQDGGHDNKEVFII